VNPPPVSFFDFIPDRKTVTKSAVNSVLIQFLLKAKGFITLPIITYLMAPHEMGMFHIIAVTSAMIFPIFTLNLPDGTVIFFVQEKSIEKIQSMYMTVINAILVWTGLLAVLASVGILVFRRDLVAVSLWVVLMYFGEVFYKLGSQLLTIYQKTDILLRNAFVRDLSIAACSILLVYLGLSYKGLVIGAGLGFTVSGFFLYRIVFRRISYTFRIERAYLKPFFRISLPLLPVFFFQWIIRSSDTYILAYFKGGDVVGKYGVVYGLCNVVLIFMSALHFFWFPVSVRLWEEDREKYRQAFRTLFIGAVTVLGLSVLLFELNAKLIMNFLVSRVEYREAYVIMGMIAFAFAMQVMITLLTAPLYSNRNPNLIFVSYFSTAGLNTLLNFLLIPSMSFVGAALSTAVSYLAVVILMSFLNVRVARFRFLDRRVWVVGGIFAVLWVGIGFLREHLDTAGLLAADVLLVLLLGGLAFFVGMTGEERRGLSGFLKYLRSGKYLKK